MQSSGYIDFNDPSPAQSDPPPDNSNPQSTPETELKKLTDLAIQSNEPLMQLKTYRWYSIFQHQIVIDVNKVTVIFNEFFKSRSIHSIMIKDINDVLVNTSLIYAALEIVDDGFTQNSIVVKHLKKSEATQARKVIQGLVVAHHKEVDLTKIPTGLLLEKLLVLGEGQPTT